LTNYFKERSKLLFILTIFEILLSIWYLSYFNYLDRLNYYENINLEKDSLALLLQNMFTSTFWGLLIILIALSAISSLIALLYKDEKFELISSLIWCIVLILSFDLHSTFKDNISNILIIGPIVLFSFIAFFKQKSLKDK